MKRQFPCVPRRSVRSDWFQTRFAFAVLTVAFLAALCSCVSGNAQDEDVVLVNARPVFAQDEDLVVVNARPVFNDENFNQFVFRTYGNAQHARKRIDTMLALQTEEVDRVCALAEAQKKKLQLAGRGDIKRFFDRVEEARTKFQSVKNDQNKLPQFLQEIQPLQTSLSVGLFGDDSIFAKTLRSTLSVDQLERYDKVDQDRRSFRHLAKIEMAVATFDNALPLRDDQRQKLVALLLQETKLPKRSSANDYYIVLAQMARIPDERLKPIFDERQWRTLRRTLDRMKGMEEQLRKAGVLADLEEENEDF